jgi:Protein of unknown function (DUF3574)
MKPPGLLLATIPALLTACSSMGPPCPAGQQRMASEYLYFGTDKPGGRVSEAQWRDFLDQTVTPRFPAGLSVWQAAGQWRSQAGPIVREPSYVLHLIHDRQAQRETDIAAIVQAYKTEHAQEAVMRVTSTACVSF